MFLELELIEVFVVEFIIPFMKSYAMIVDDSTYIDGIVKMFSSLCLIELVFIGSNHI